MESFKEQVADQEELLLASKRDCDALQAEIARIQTENDSAKVCQLSVAILCLIWSCPINGRAILNY